MFSLFIFFGNFTAVELFMHFTNYIFALKDSLQLGVYSDMMNFHCFNPLNISSCDY